MPAGLPCLPTTVLEQIALEVAVASFLGPPHNLIPLLLTCRSVYHALCLARNPHLYAAIFRCKFDHHAAHRRLGKRATFPSNVAQQLKACCVALTRIRRGDIAAESVEDDLWTAYLMMMDNDGQNVQQLAWAGLKDFVLRFVKAHLHNGAERGLPRENATNTLALWLLWFTSEAAEVGEQTAEVRHHLMDLVRPYVVLPVRYASFYQPDNHFDFPIPDGPPVPYSRTVHGTYPLYRPPEMFRMRRTHFNLPMNMTLPPISLAAKLLYFSRGEVDTYAVPDTLPIDRQAAFDQGIHDVFPTQADYIAFNAHKAAKTLASSDKLTSAKWENDWGRNCCSWNPWVFPTQIRSVYTPGLIAGDWMGRMLLPDPDQYWSVVMSENAHVPLGKPAMSAVPISFRLQEHHCIDPRAPVPSGGPPDDDFDDGIINAWLPSDTTIHHARSTVTMKNAEGETIGEYETHVEGKKNSHQEATCSMCNKRREAAEAIMLKTIERAQCGNCWQKRRGSQSSHGNEDSRGLGDAYNGISRGKRPRRPLQPDHHEGNWTAPEAALHAVAGWALPAQEDREVEDARAEVQRLIGPVAGSVDQLLSTEMQSMDAFSYNLSNNCTGIRDIIITGESLPKHSQAWHHYKVYGRVRPFDGLIALLRVPTQVPEMGTSIFRGYVVAGQNFVGSWRVWARDRHAIPLEGPFIASRFEGEG